MTTLPPPSQVRRIACLMLGAIGDFIVTTPTQQALRAAYPDARITLVIREAQRGLAEGSPWIDEILPLRSGAWSRLALPAALLMRRWDLWVDLHVPTFNTFGTNAHVFRRNAFLMRAAGARFRLAFDDPALSAGLTHPVPTPSMDEMAVENIAITTRRLLPGAAPSPLRKSLPPRRAEAMAAVDRVLAAEGAGDRPLVSVFFGSNQPSGVWPYERVLAFCRRLPERFPGFRFPLLGGPNERVAVDRLHGDIGALFPPLIDLTGRLTLPETAAVMARSRAVVATDSGPMHMADALGVPLVALFGAKNPMPLWLPLTPDAKVITHGVPCAGCLRNICDRDNLCMSLITEDEVLSALHEAIGVPA